MGRPIKSGLDYFPVDILFDNSMDLLQAECGVQAIGIIIKIWQKIYQNGYYAEWNEDTELLFCKNNVVSKQDMNTFMGVCFKRKLFDENLYKKYGILTSCGIQKRFLQISKDCKRTTISVISEYKLVNGEYSDIITEETHISTEISTQRKEKEEKEEKEIEIEKKMTAFDIAFENFKEMRKKKKAPVTENIQKLILSKLNKLSSDETTQIAILEKSTINNWTDVYALKQEDMVMIPKQPEKEYIEYPPYTPQYGIDLNSEEYK